MSKRRKFYQGFQHLKQPIYIIASRASKSAIDTIEKNGGKIVCKYYNTLALRDCVEGRIDRISAAPTRREDISELASVSQSLLLGSPHYFASMVWRAPESRVYVASHSQKFGWNAICRGALEITVERVGAMEKAGDRGKEVAYGYIIFVRMVYLHPYPCLIYRYGATQSERLIWKGFGKHI